MDIQLFDDSSVSNAPAGFTTALQYAASILDNLITNNITVNIGVGWGEITTGGSISANGTVAGGTSSTVSTGGRGGPVYDSALTYDQVAAGLYSTYQAAPTAALYTAFLNLPNSDISNGNGFAVSTSLQKAWGILPASSTTLDGQVGFATNDSTGYSWDFSTTDRAVSNEEDFVGAALHELTHALGRVSDAGFDQYPTTLDLYRYTSQGNLDFGSSSSTTPYFSIDGGQTNLGYYAPSSDPADWGNSSGGGANVPADSFDANGTIGVEQPLTATDITELNVMGFAVAPCFAAGTSLATLTGAVAVDRLRPGDLLRTAGGALRPVRWIGHRSIDLTRHPDPRRAQPIRIRADAFADGIPARDLLLSPDHAVFDRGRLIPIRLLVNGATITRETRRRKITYYHVELDSHDLLLAEGLPAESYLDCNNRGIFQNAPEPLILHPDFYDPAAQAARRLATSCAPLTDAAELVAPLWWRLADRAVALGFPVPTPSFTTEPALAVRAGGRTGGRTLAPAARDGATYRFALPAGPATLLSRAAYPQDATPWLEDQRRLGVMVRALRLGNEPIPLDHPTFTAGWWAPETDGTARWRWTDGEAVLGTLTAPAELAVTLGDTLPYPRRRAA